MFDKTIANLYAGHVSCDELRELCISYDVILENIMDGIFITDGRGIVIGVNSAYESMSGLHRDDVLGLNIREFERLNYISKSATMITLERKTTTTLIQKLLASGREALVNCNPLFDEDGNISLVVSNLKDITDIETLKANYRAEQELSEKYLNEITALKSQLFSGSHIITKSEKMLNILYSLKQSSKVNSTVTITGETGTGKEEIAKFIHENSPRKNQHFIKVNCGAISPQLLESELFGYEGGAFTGANRNGKIGLLEIAHQGTIFLDEIGDMPLDMQVKLLRFLQSGEIIRVGGSKTIKLDVRVITATNKDLKELIKKNLFREDLFYRIDVIRVHLPPLRERVSDIRLLATHYLDLFNKKYDLHKTISESTFQKLESYSWPGNIRELINFMERCVVFNDSHSFPGAKETTASAVSLMPASFNLKKEMELMEYKYLKEAYEKHKTVRDAAKSLELTKSTFAYKLKLYEQKYSRSSSL